MQRILRPLARLRFNTALPLVVLIRIRKPCVRAKDFLDLFLLVWQSAGFPALTTNRWHLSVLTPVFDAKSNPNDKPEKEEERDEEGAKKEQWSDPERVEAPLKETALVGLVEPVIKVSEAEGVRVVMAAPTLLDSNESVAILVCYHLFLLPVIAAILSLLSLWEREETLSTLFLYKK